MGNHEEEQQERWRPQPSRDAVSLPAFVEGDKVRVGMRFTESVEGSPIEVPLCRPQSIIAYFHPRDPKATEA